MRYQRPERPPGIHAQTERVALRLSEACRSATSSEIASSPRRGRQSRQYVGEKPAYALRGARGLPRTDGSEPGFGQMNELRPNAIKRLPRGTEARLLHRSDRKRKIFVRNLP